MEGTSYTWITALSVDVVALEAGYAVAVPVPGTIARAELVLATALAAVVAVGIVLQENADLLHRN